MMRTIKYLVLTVIALSILSCNKSSNLKNPKNNDEVFKLLKKQMEKPSMLDYNLVFDNGTYKGLPIELLEIGDLKVPSGQIVVCDPIAYYEMQPLNRRVSPGEYPIKIYVANTQESGKRYAIAKLEFSKEKAKRWIMALRDNEDINELTHEDEYFGFSVDAGLGGFLDYQAGLEYQEFEKNFMKENPNGNIYNDLFAREFKKNAIDQNDPNDIGDWINFQLPNSELNITMFHSGYGDGVYPAYWGIDKNDEIVSLVIDFLVLEPSDS